MESLLAGELKGLGAERVKQTRAGASFEGSLETAYRVCLWSRLAGRVLLPLRTGPAGDGDELYATAQHVHWDTHVGVDGTVAVDFTGMNDAIRDTRYGAVRVKDAIVDQFRGHYDGRRPSVDVRAPDLRVNAHLARGRVTISIDLSGDSLHRRGYRTDRVQVEAPLKENLAAAMLLFAAWPKEAAAGGSFYDPLCGSGTLLIEAAWLAADIAPGLLRAERPDGFAFMRWRGHDARLWERLVTEARMRREAGLCRLAATPDPRIAGSDHDPRAVQVAKACVSRAGLGGVVSIASSELSAARAPAPRGLVATNAPYGARLGRREDAEALTRALGERLRGEFGGWHVALLAGSDNQTAAVGLPVLRDTTLYNGPIPCKLAYFEVGAGAFAAPRDARAAARSSARPVRSVSEPPPAEPAKAPEELPQTIPADRAPLSAPPASAPGPWPGALLAGSAEQFANRLRKNLRSLGRQLRKESITCYRVYDADLPDYNLVVDVYGDWVHVQEYAPPAQIDPTKVRRRLQDALAVIASTLTVPPERVVLKERRRQRGAAQYERHTGNGVFLPVEEDELTYLVNLHDYLDTGFFLDQRLTRRLVRRLAGGRRFLNLFAYTGTMTVNALAAGAPGSTTVDLSSTYLTWAKQNLEANGFVAELALSAADNTARRTAGAAPPNLLVQADCLRWLAEAEGQYDLIWLDPPTFSNSKRMGRATFDVQRDHADLVRLTTRRLLAPGGVLLFSTNRRGFKLDYGELGGLAIKDLSRATLPFDCSRSANRHHVFRIERSPEPTHPSTPRVHHG
jgi:23S rRNA (guanine2445-N2)-methyltransferase / 23S rRNA (guanine2069-N7)-methyltransferase